MRIKYWIFGISLLVGGCAGTYIGAGSLIGSKPPGIDTPLVREVIVATPIEQVWTRLLTHVKRPGYRVYTASKDSGILSFALLTVPGDGYVMSLITGEDEIWASRGHDNIWAGFDGVAYEAELYVTTLVTPINTNHTKIHVRSLVRVLAEHDNTVYDVTWFSSGSGRIEQEMFNAAKGS